MTGNEASDKVVAVVCCGFKIDDDAGIIIRSRQIYQGVGYYYELPKEV